MNLANISIVLNFVTLNSVRYTILMNDFKQLNTLLPALFNANDKEWQLHLLANWATIIGKASSKARIEKIDNTTLIIAVQDSVWMQELYLLSDTIIQKINTFLGKDYITSLRFKKAGLKKELLKKNLLPTRMIQKPFVLSHAEHACLARITDEEIKKHLLAYLRRCKS
jgi:hypothetical protein